jgi:hypothetical protein
MLRQILFILILISLFCFIQNYISDVEAQGMASVNLNLIPTAETLGKGGYSFSTGMYPYSINKRSSKPMEIDIGGFFKEMHDTRIESDIWLVPTRITYGISDRLDFAFGGTYSMGNTEKSIKDYYEIGDETKERVYSQMILDGMMGMKYNLQKPSINMPALTLGSEIYLGYTVDDELVDKTLSDSFPFVAMQVYMSGSYDFKVANLHGGVGMLVSSKSVQTNKRFDIPIQLGAEIPFGGFSAVIDYTTFKAFSGIGLKSVISGGLRYDISSRAILNASFASVGGFTISLTVGGKKAETTTTQPSSAPSLF